MKMADNRHDGTQYLGTAEFRFRGPKTANFKMPIPYLTGHLNRVINLALQQVKYLAFLRLQSFY
jgi:hypothetical protein